MPLFILSLFFAACTSTTLPANGSASVIDTLPVLQFSQGTVPTYFDQLGINMTWATDSLIDGNPELAAGRFRHVRYFQMMEKDFAGATPGSGALAPCADLKNPWSCPERSMRQHLVRVQRLRTMFPEGYVWVAPEVLQDRGWPCKNWTPDELGLNPEAAGYAWAKAALATYGGVGGVILAMTNEEWCAGPERVNAYNAWRRGIIRAHRENPSCQLAIGARHIRSRAWDGNRMPDNVLDVASDVWSYIDSVGGWADYHAHGIVGDRFEPPARASQAEDYRDFFAWSAWLDESYPNIRKAVGEIAYTSSAPGVLPTAVQKRADWATWAELVRQLAEEADIVFLYQIAEHPHPEGAFSGSGVLPDLAEEVEVFAREPRR